MKILRVAQTLYPDVTGGGAYHVHAMSRDQAAMGHDVTVLTVRTEPEQPHVEERDGYTVVRYDPTVELLGNAVSPGLARHLLDADDVDVVHAHSHLYFSTNVAAALRRLGETPLAITNHGLYSQTAPEWVFDAYLRTLGRWTFDQADLVFCYTEEERERVRSFGVSSPVAVVDNGVDTERFTPDGPRSDRVDADGPALLFVGRLVEGKRPGLAVDAVEALREEFPGVRLYVCGEGPLREPLEARVEGDLAEHVTFLDHVPYDEMPAIYRSADLLVLPSRAEGVPRTVLEAAASGTPVVTAQLDQLEEIVRGNGATVPVEDTERFAGEVASILRSERASEPAAAGHGEYDWDRTVERTTRQLATLVEDEPYEERNKPSLWGTPQ